MVASRWVVIVAAGLAPLACSDPGSATDEVGETASGDGDGDPSTGDGDGDPSTGDGDGDPSALRPNWHQDIAPLVTANCVGCHSEGGIAPFTMNGYAETAPWSALMADSMETGYMPPWHALETAECEPEFTFKHDPRMTADQIALVRDWVDLGAPEGDVNLAAPLPEPQDLDLASPSATVGMQGSVEVAVQGQTRDFFHCVSLDPGNTEDVFLDGLQVIPGNRAIVHHVLVYVDEGGQSANWANGIQENCGGGSGGIPGALVSGWVPGGLPMEPPDGVGISLPAGARLVLNVHYHATGGTPETDDSTGMALRWSTQKPAYASTFQLIGAPGIGDSTTGAFLIPAGATGHKEEFTWTVPAFPDSVDVRLWAVANHMHKVGVNERIWLERAADGNEECVLQTPNWDFNWQRVYEIDSPIDQTMRVYGGDIVHVSCEYDNSMANAALVEALAEVGQDAPVDVSVGEGTLDEMCLAGVGVGIKGL